MGFLAKIGKILRAFSRKILRTTTRMVLTPVALVGDVIDWIWTPRQIVDEEIVEDAGSTTVEDAGARDVVEDEIPLLRRPPQTSLATLIKRACLEKAAGNRRWDGVFNAADHEHYKAKIWITTLDDTAVSLMQYMPMARLGDHLETDCCVGYGLLSWKNFDATTYVTKTMERERQAAARRATVNDRFGREFCGQRDEAA